MGPTARLRRTTLPRRDATGTPVASFERAAPGDRSRPTHARVRCDHRTRAPEGGSITNPNAPGTGQHPGSDRLLALRFLVPSLIGLALFAAPVIESDRQTLLFAIIVDVVTAGFGATVPWWLLTVLVVAALGSLAVRLLGLRVVPGTPAHAMFAASWLWIALRCAGAAITAAVLFDVGPQLVRLPDTGRAVVHDVASAILMIYLVGLLLMPLLTEYGLMEFVGALCGPWFRLLFRLPGRAAIDALASIVTAAAIGLLITLGQYERGHYSARQAATIACNFSIVSIPFSLLIAQVAGIETLFLPWFATVVVTCLICAAAMARLPPLSRLDDTVIRPEAPMPSPWAAALARAADSPTPLALLRAWIHAFLATSCNVLGPSVTIATATTILLFHTPVVDALAAPLTLTLGGLGVDAAATIAPGMLIGFADQFMPALVAAQLDARFWQFVLAGLSVTQLIYMSELGLIIIRSPLPLGVRALLTIFALRTLICLPLLLVGAALFVSD